MMSSLDASAFRRPLSECTRAKLESLELFGEIASTNTYLMSQPAPTAGHCRVAIADHQTSGRGRHNRHWLSHPGDGLCLSLAYTFEKAPEHLPALTLALGVGVIGALQGLNVSGCRLKWPNDIVARDGKLGGILTEAVKAAEVLADKRIDVTVVNARFAKPVDERIADMVMAGKTIVTIEDHSIACGFGSAVMELVAERQAGKYKTAKNPTNGKVIVLGGPDGFVRAGLRSVQLDDIGISTARIVDLVMGIV